MRAVLLLLLAVCAVSVCAQQYRGEYRPDSREYYKKKYESDEDDSKEHSKERHYKKDHSDEHDDSDEHPDKIDSDEHDDDDDDSDEYKKDKYYNKKYDSRENYYKKGKFDSDEKYYKKYDSEEHYKKKYDWHETRSVPDESDEYNDAVYFSKRKLQFHEEKPEEDAFFDDVKAYYQRENYVPNYREEYKRFNRDDRRKDDSDEKYRNSKRYYKERYYEIEKPDVEKEKYWQVRDEKEFRQPTPESEYLLIYLCGSGQRA